MGSIYTIDAIRVEKFYSGGLLDFINKNKGHGGISPWPWTARPRQKPGRFAFRPLTLDWVRTPVDIDGHSPPGLSFRYRHDVGSRGRGSDHTAALLDQ